MRKRQRLGQHFLISQTVAKKIAEAARITKKDVVLEIGTGRGILVPLLCEKAKKVISIEADSVLYQDAKKRFSGIANLALRNGDGFKTDEKFSIFVSNLPYSKSRKAMEWLIQKKFSGAIVMVQKEFYEKLVAKGKNRKAISVLVNYSSEIEKIINVKKTNFNPPPKVDSVVLQLKRKKTISKELVQTTNKLFSYKRKNLKNIFKQFGKKIESDKRLEELSSEEIINIAKQVLR
ncbi:putative ribosomal RNA small subunit methyltransferase A [archaeon MnTg01]|nr:putative ribosomal RNA small subunit methyltransferase A [archaeon MnTg01]